MIRQYERNVMSFFSVLDLIRINGKDASKNYSMLKEELEKPKPDAERVRMLAIQAMRNYLRIKDLARKFEYQQINSINDLIRLLAAQHIYEIGLSVQGENLEKVLKEALKTLREERHEEKRLIKGKTPRRTLTGRLLRERNLTRKRMKLKKYREILTEHNKTDDIHKRLIMLLNSQPIDLEFVHEDLLRDTLVEYILSFEHEFEEIFSIYTKDDFEQYKVMDLLTKLQSHTNDEELKKAVEEVLSQTHHLEEKDLHQSKQFLRHERRLLRKAVREVKQSYNPKTARFTQENCLLLLEKIVILRDEDRLELKNLSFQKLFLANAQAFLNHDLHVPIDNLSLENIVTFFNTAHHFFVHELATLAAAHYFDRFAPIIAFINQHKSVPNVNPHDLALRLILLAKSPFDDLERYSYLLNDPLNKEILARLTEILYDKPDRNDRDNLIYRFSENLVRPLIESCVSILQVNSQTGAQSIQETLRSFMPEDALAILKAVITSPYMEIIILKLPIQSLTEMSYQRSRTTEYEDKKHNVLRNISIINTVLKHKLVPLNSVRLPIKHILTNIKCKDSHLKDIILYATTGEDLLALLSLDGNSPRNRHFKESLGQLIERGIISPDGQDTPLFSHHYPLFRDFTEKNVALVAKLVQKGISRGLAQAFCFEIEKHETAEQAVSVYERLIPMQFGDTHEVIGGFLPGDLVQLSKDPDSIIYSVGAPITRKGYRLIPVEKYLNGSNDELMNIPAWQLNYFVEDEDWRSVEKLREKGFLILHASDAFKGLSVTKGGRGKTPFEMMEYNLIKANPKRDSFSAHSIHPLGEGTYRTAAFPIGKGTAIGVVFDKGHISHAWDFDAQTENVSEGYDRLPREKETPLPELPVRLAIKGHEGGFRNYNELILQKWHVEGIYLPFAPVGFLVDKFKVDVLELVIKHKLSIYLMEHLSQKWTAYDYTKDGYVYNHAKSTAHFQFPSYNVWTNPEHDSPKNFPELQERFRKILPRLGAIMSSDSASMNQDDRKVA